MKHIALVWLLLVGLPGLAAAQGSDPVFDPLSMDRLTPRSTVSADLGYEVWDEPDGTEIDVMSLNLAGHFVNDGGVGAYVTIPLSYLSLALPPLFDETDLALGNIEAGALLARVYGGSTALVFHAGVALPTASDGGAADFQGYAAFTRFGDLVHRVPNSTWVRFGLSPMGRSGSLFWRADVGLDLALDDDNAVEISPVLHLNVGGGIDLGSAVLIGELVNVIVDPDNDSDDSAATFTFGARFESGNLHPGIGLLLPIDLDAFENFEFALVASLAVHIAN
ncbi:MAG: hypothetical protein H0X17_12510 [Deltaproteobacteria bacterium]|nr:hypothetical protein [Deltaproteobacteria bacterium]